VDKIVLPTISVLIGIIGLFLGIILGSLLGRVGALEILAFILRIPLILIRSPKKLRAKWKTGQELRDARKVERLKRQKEIKDLKDKIGEHKKEIKKLRSRVCRIKWEFREPK